jgi:hypothetical protein
MMVGNSVLAITACLRLRGCCAGASVPEEAALVAAIQTASAGIKRAMGLACPVTQQAAG